MEVHGKFTMKERTVLRKYRPFIDVCKYSTSYSILLNSGYFYKDSCEITAKTFSELTQKLSLVTRPASQVIKIAFSGFHCPLCGTYVPRGTNYLDADGIKLCSKEMNQ